MDIGQGELRTSEPSPSSDASGLGPIVRPGNPLAVAAACGAMGWVPTWPFAWALRVSHQLSMPVVSVIARPDELILQLENGTAVHILNPDLLPEVAAPHLSRGHSALPDPNGNPLPGEPRCGD